MAAASTLTLNLPLLLIVLGVLTSKLTPDSFQSKSPSFFDVYFSFEVVLSDLELKNMLKTISVLIIYFYTKLEDFH